MRLALLASAVLSLAACADDAPATQDIGGGPRGDVCQLVEAVPCSTPVCRDPDCVAPRYWCCSYGEIGQPLGCSYVVDLAQCWYSYVAAEPPPAA